MNLRKIAVVVILLLAASACAGDESDGDGASTTAGGTPSGEEIVFWTAEDNAVRVEATKDIAEAFTAETGIPVNVVAIAEDQLSAQVSAAAAADDLPDLFGAISLGFVHSLAADEFLDTDAAGEIIDSLGRDTFASSALDLVSVDGTPVAVPSDGWVQLLVYRTDLFEAAGLAVPDNYEAIREAALALNSDDMAGIVAATGPADSFTQQTFEYFAVGNGCEVVDDAGAVTIASPECVGTFEFYSDIIQNGSVPGLQDADTTRASYFAGQSAMIVWSSFILDEMGGLRSDALPTCPECEDNPSFLVENSGIVSALSGPDGEPALFGEVVSFAVVDGGNVEGSKAFIEYMMSDGYVDWLALAPEGKIPVRLGSADNPTEYAEAWQGLETGVDSRAPLSELYSEEVLTGLTEGVTTMKRWGFAQGQGHLVGPLLVELPIPRALALALDGSLDASGAAQEAEAGVTDIVESVG